MVHVLECMLSSKFSTVVSTARYLFHVSILKAIQHRSNLVSTGGGLSSISDLPCIIKSLEEDIQLVREEYKQQLLIKLLPIFHSWHIRTKK